MQAVDLVYNYYALCAAILGPRKPIDTTINKFSPSRYAPALPKLQRDDDVTREMILLREQGIRYKAIAEQYQTTDNAVRSRIQKYNARCLT